MLLTGISPEIILRVMSEKKAFKMKENDGLHEKYRV